MTSSYDVMAIVYDVMAIVCDVSALRHCMDIDT